MEVDKYESHRSGNLRNCLPGVFHLGRGRSNFNHTENERQNLTGGFYERQRENKVIGTAD